MNYLSFVKNTRTICIFNLNRWGYVRSDISGFLVWSYENFESSIAIESSINSAKPHLRLKYTVHAGNEVKRDYHVFLEQMNCNFGGVRWWFLCPLERNGSPCNKRVAKLYYRDTWYGCRYCMNLAYEKQHQYFGRYSEEIRKILRYQEANASLKELRIKKWNGRLTKRARRLSEKIERNSPPIDPETYLINLL